MHSQSEQLGRHAHARGVHRRRGIGALYVVIVLVAVFAMATLAMDYGRVQLAKYAAPHRGRLRPSTPCSG